MIDNVTWHCDVLSPHAPVVGFRRVFPFELMTNPSWHIWWRQNWTLCFWISALYVVAVPLGQRLMRNRPALEIRGPLLAWNLMVACYSLLSGARVATEILTHARRDGFLASICELGPVEHQKLLGTYLVFFSITKVVELGDTFFLILRHKPVPMAHCFHHSLVLIVTWGSTAYPSVVSVYFMAMNQGVHVLAYTRLSLQTMKVRLPSVVTPLLTALELLQAVAGLGLTLYAGHVKSSGTTCCLFLEIVDMIYVAYVAFAIVFSKVMLDVALRWRASNKVKSA